ncbi:MAG: hypothetical protein JOZ69_09450 [Myxococcales bacterium]|nr:hypothetical protein [Myxococcales bacterium]
MSQSLDDLLAQLRAQDSGAGDDGTLAELPAPGATSSAPTGMASAPAGAMPELPALGAMGSAPSVPWQPAPYTPSQAPPPDLFRPPLQPPAQMHLPQPDLLQPLRRYLEQQRPPPAPPKLQRWPWEGPPARPDVLNKLLAEGRINPHEWLAGRTPAWDEPRMKGFTMPKLPGMP